MTKAQFLSFLLLFSCSNFLESTQKDYHVLSSKNDDTKELSIIFSGNINGELEPCGCRKFPLGGMPQVKGLIEEEKKHRHVIYVDIGDTFFSSPVIPQHVQKSLATSAQYIFESLHEMPLHLFTPGDQDFALGADYLAEFSKQAKFDFLISNLSDASNIKAKPWHIIKYGNRKIIFLGVVDPDLVMNSYQHHFLKPDEALNTTFDKLSSQIQKNDLVILMSHSGMDADLELAKNFPRINWILGSHSQSYTTYPKEEGNTKLVQVLSRNHYLGKLEIPFHSKGEIKFSLLETRDETAQLIKPNPLDAVVANHKSSLKKVQSIEQLEMSRPQDQVGIERKATYLQCLQCHQPQGEFWQSTAHAVSFATLIQKSAQFNEQCIGCHSLGYKDENGFKSSHEIIQNNQKTLTNQEKKTYWKKIDHYLHSFKSIRSTSPIKRAELSKNWIKLDKDSNVTHNYAHVQCLNCHQVTPNHPIGITKSPVKISTCLSCHTSDQSPEWYQENKPKEQFILKKMQDISCPKG